MSVISNVVITNTTSAENSKSSNNIWPIAWVSFFWSTASLMVLSILPIFLSEELHVSNKYIGLLEGIAVATAFAAKVFAGTISDYLRCRKPLILLGSIITVITKPLFAIAVSSSMIFMARFFDRLGKGLRSAPADAFIANISDNSTATHNYGIRQALYALGTVCGSSVTVLLMFLLPPINHNLRIIFSLATIPALIALLILWHKVSEPKIIIPNHNKFSLTWHWADIWRLPKNLWLILLISGFLMMARFSEMFMLLQAKQAGWQINLLPLIFIIIDLFHAVSAFANKKLVDRYGEYGLLNIGFLLLILADIMFAISNNYFLIIIGIILNGLHLGLTQGILRAMIAKTCNNQQHLVGTAFSLFYLISGFGVLIGNFMAGSLADSHGLPTAFLGGMVTTMLSMLIFFVTRKIWVVKK